MRNNKTIIVVVLLCLLATLFTRQDVIAGIITAVIPAAVPTSSKNGNGTKFQIFTGSAPTSGNCGSFDANGNLTDFGSPCNGTAGSVAWTNVLTGTNTTTLHVGTGGVLDTTGTGSIIATSLAVNPITSGTYASL